MKYSKIKFIFVMIFICVLGISVNTLQASDSADENLTISGYLKFSTGASAGYMLQSSDGEGSFSWFDGSNLADVTAVETITGNWVNTTNPWSINEGGTGASTQLAAFDGLSPLTTKGDVIVFNGTNNIRLGVGTNGQAIVADSAETSGLRWTTLTGSDVGLGNVENIALSTWTGTTNIITLGTVTTASGNVSLWTNNAGYLINSNNLSDVSNAETSRTNLGVTIGSDVQSWDTNLDDIAGLTSTDGNIIVGDGANWVSENGDTARTSLGLGTGDSPQFTGLTLTSNMNIGTNSILGTTAIINFTNFDVESNGKVTVNSFAGAGLSDCDGANDKLQWDATTSTFSCGTDQGAENVFSGYDSTGGVSVTTIEATLNIDATNTSGTAYSLSADEITINESGTYLIVANVTISTDDATGERRAYFTLTGQDDISGSFVDIGGAECSDYIREPNQTVTGSCAISWIKNYSNTDKIRLRHVNSDTTTMLTMVNASGITITKLSD